MTRIADSAYDCEWLPRGLGVLLRGLHGLDDASGTICASCELAAKGMRAVRAGIFLVKHRAEGVRLETLSSVGFTEAELRDIECRRESEWSKSRCIWDVIARSSVTTEDTDWLSEIDAEASAAGQVLCVPIRDSILNVLVAVMYIEKAGDAAGFGPPEKEWIENYRLVLSQILHLGFSHDSADELSKGRGFSKFKGSENAPELVGDSLQIQGLRNQLHEVYIPAANSPDPDPILILGEKGTGKDLVARYIYACSSRSNQPYVAVNCAEITDELAAARFFGHKRGSFTGSLSNEPGLFRAANRGILFLDEIGDLSLRAQGTLLRVLENRTVVPLGETRETRVDVQVILATNRDTERAVAEGLIRADLLDRFSTQEIRLAPLRERPWDIPALIRHFIAHHTKRTQKRTLGLHPEVLRTMVGYSWPGNVRELARVCSLLVTHASAGTLIDMVLFNRLLPAVASKERNPKAEAMLMGDVPMRDALETFGRELILARLKRHNWNVRSARESLGLPKTTFHRYARALGIAAIPRSDDTHLEVKSVRLNS